jgi:dTMP kinase
VTNKIDPLFIVVEGIDGVGSTTCSKLLVQLIQSYGNEALWTKEPSDGTIGRHIRRVLKHQESASEASMFPLFLADRHDHIESTIIPELSQGSTVVCDRYFPSTWVYQQDNYDRLLIEQMHRNALAPDYIFILLATVEECMKRMGDREDRERYEVEELQRQYAVRYANYGPHLPRIGHEKIIHIDTMGLTAEEVAIEMAKYVGVL